MFSRQIPRIARSCKLCGVPFTGLRGWYARTFKGIEPFYKNPNICNSCNISLPLGHGTHAVISVLFADIRGYSGWARHQPPERLIALLNRMFEQAINILLIHDGCIDKFMGDQIMAVFGSPIPREDHALQAVEAGLELQRAVATLATPEGGTLAMGIGIHTGEAIVGNIGSQYVRDFTAIGDTVNLAAGLQQAAASGEVLVTAATMAVLPEAWRAAEQRHVQVKGRDELVLVHVFRAS
jgi:adenylate cyclase